MSNSDQGVQNRAVRTLLAGSSFLLFLRQPARSRRSALDMVKTQARRGKTEARRLGKRAPPGRMIPVYLSRRYEVVIN